MQLIAYSALLLALLAAVITAGFAAFSAWSGNKNGSRLLEYGNYGTAFAVAYASAMLLGALVSRNYGFMYVYENVDNTLSFMYTITAFWGGRAGSLLFWELIIAASGVIFAVTPTYQSLSESTKQYFWMFFMLIQAFFLLLLTCWSNPFIELTPIPADGRGLNPLLRNPGMIFHPPLLFLGFAGYTIPAAVAMAAALTGERQSWVNLTRNWNVLAWVFLTAGIILGGWWSYMELGWGGYWAWDPVENASLIPWFAGTAYLHTAIAESRRGVLKKTNVLLIVLTFLLCIFSTYLTRSGVIESLHSFGESGVSVPLFISMMTIIALGIAVVVVGHMEKGKDMGELFSREGMLVAAAWFFLAMGLVVTLGTMWPVISQLWSAKSVGLDANFYNRVCLPFLAILVFAFCICPWMGWKSGIRNKNGLFGTAGIFFGAMVLFWFMGIHKPVALFAAAAGIAVIGAVVLLFALEPAYRKSRNSWGQYLIHMGVGMLTLGIAFSGPYKKEEEFSIREGGVAKVGQYQVSLEKFVQDSTPEFRARITATLRVSRDGKSVGVMKPEKRIYQNFPNQQFAEVSVIPSLGEELYATLHGYDNDQNISMTVSINPLVNWVWIGGTLMCLAGFLLVQRIRPQRFADEDADDNDVSERADA